MPQFLPNAPLKKDDLRSLLQATEAGLPATSRPAKAAQRWAKVIYWLDELSLTSEGRLVIERDPYLEATVTDWLIHFHLSSGNWKVWTSFVYDFLPNHTTFASTELINFCASLFPNENPENLKNSIRLILRTYTETSAIAKNKFLVKTGDQFSTGKPDLSNPYTIGYLLAKIWERNFRSQTSVLIDELLKIKQGLANVLGISIEQLRQQLDILERYEIIEQRSAIPHLAGTKTRRKQDTEASYQIVRCWDDPEKLLQQAYENDTATPNQPLIRSLEGILDDDDDIPDFSKFLEWVVHLSPRQANLLPSFGSIAI